MKEGIPADDRKGSEQQSGLSDHLIPAVKLMNTPEGGSAFVRGFIPSLAKTSSKNLYFSNTFEAWQKGTHPAPKSQYVVTMKGKLTFQVSDGGAFIIEPGIILIASDVHGEGHKWDFVEGDEWVRVYIPIDGHDNFIAEGSVA